MKSLKKKKLVFAAISCTFGLISSKMSNLYNMTGGRKAKRALVFWTVYDAVVVAVVACSNQFASGKW